MTSVPIVVVAAIKQEFDAIKAAWSKTEKDKYGVSAWHEDTIGGGLAYLKGDYVTSNGKKLSIVLARPPRMGTPSVAPLLGSFVREFGPYCLAMSGVCAGNPAEVTLGDVVISEIAYFYDEGKRNVGNFEPDHRQSPMLSAWVQAAQDLSIDDLPSYGEATDREAKFWLLECLQSESDPTKHLARHRYFPKNMWRARLKRYESEGLVRRNVDKLELLPLGRQMIVEKLFYDIPPKKLPFRSIVGPFASGNAVVKDGITWESLKRAGIRTPVGLEMEAAVVGLTARELGVPSWVVVKGVMDYADPRKDDRYKSFAARASAEVLLKFVENTVLPWIEKQQMSVPQIWAERIERLIENVDLASSQISELADRDIRTIEELESLLAAFPSSVSTSIAAIAEHFDKRLGFAMGKLVRTARDGVAESRKHAVLLKGKPGSAAAQSEVVEPMNGSNRRLVGAIDRINLIIPGWIVKNQGDRGTSVAFACTAAIEHYLYSLNNNLELLSEEYLNWAIHASNETEERDGTFLEHASKALKLFGICAANFWPYDPVCNNREHLQNPSKDALDNAFLRRFWANNFTNITAQHFGRSQMVLDVLRRGKVVVVTVPVFADPVQTLVNNWETNVGRLYGRVLDPPIRSVVVGGHAICVVGFVPDQSELNGGYFIFRNSWGAHWGSLAPSFGYNSPESGYGEISAGYIDSFMWEMLYI